MSIIVKYPTNSGVGPLTAVPSGTTNGTALGAPPADYHGVRFYLPAGSSVTYTVAANQPIGAPAPTYTISGSTTGSSFDEPLNGQSIFVTAVSGSPLFRWY